MQSREHVAGRHRQGHMVVHLYLVRMLSPHVELLVKKYDFNLLLLSIANAAHVYLSLIVYHTYYIWQIDKPISIIVCNLMRIVTYTLSIKLTQIPCE